MIAFPAERRTHIMVDVMSRPATTELNLIGDGCYARAISEVRLRGLNLIDLQPMETAFLAVWHSDGVTESSTPQREVVAQMLWEQDGNDERVTVKIWGP